MIALALLMASGDAVLALGTSSGDHAGIVAGTLWTLMTGQSPNFVAAASFGAMLLAWPAWAAIGPVGLALVVACRPRRRRFRYRRSD